MHSRTHRLYFILALHPAKLIAYSYFFYLYVGPSWDFIAGWSFLKISCFWKRVFLLFLLHIVYGIVFRHFCYFIDIATFWYSFDEMDNLTLRIWSSKGIHSCYSVLCFILFIVGRLSLCKEVYSFNYIYWHLEVFIQLLLFCFLTLSV